MPKITVDKNMFFSLLGKTLKREELRALLVVAKAELEHFENNDPSIKIELNDTNRPDLWTIAGLARQLRSYLGAKVEDYAFFQEKVSDKKIILVDAALKKIRPYIVGFEVSGKEVDETLLAELIQTQGKLCENFGKKRRTVAMGIYRSNIIHWPIRYIAADPDKTSFVPLECEKPMTLRTILNELEKGKEYGHLIKAFKSFPLLIDDKKETLSMPPIINSASLGSVKAGDKELFIELTGTNLHTLQLLASICACDFKDMGFTITRIKTVYPYETAFSKEVESPSYFQTEQKCSIQELNTVLGIDHKEKEITKALQKMGIQSSVDNSDTIRIKVPPYRNDFLHSVDVIEDIMIGRGLDAYPVQMPKSFTVGKIGQREQVQRKVTQTMVGLGYQEMIFPYLGSKEMHIEKMWPKGSREKEEEKIAKIENPISENYEMVRMSMFPNLLESERVSARSAYPHKMFEIGELLIKDEDAEHGFRTEQALGFLYANRKTGYTDINSIVAAILYYHDVDWEARICEDVRFITSRMAHIYAKKYKKVIGIFGETHPAVLDRFDITMPTVMGEIFLDVFV